MSAAEQCSPDQNPGITKLEVEKPKDDSMLNGVVTEKEKKNDPDSAPADPEEHDADHETNDTNIEDHTEEHDVDIDETNDDSAEPTKVNNDENDENDRDTEVNDTDSKYREGNLYTTPGSRPQLLPHPTNSYSFTICEDAMLVKLTRKGDEGVEMLPKVAYICIELDNDSWEVIVDEFTLNVLQPSFTVDWEYSPWATDDSAERAMRNLGGMSREQATAYLDVSSALRQRT